LCNQFVAQSLHAGEAGKRLVWTPHVKVCGDLFQYRRSFEAYNYVDGDLPAVDPFCNINIIENNLEVEK